MHVAQPAPHHGPELRLDLNGKQSFSMQKTPFMCYTKRDFSQLVFNFLPNKILKISIWHPSKHFAVIIALFNFSQKNVNISLLEYSFSSSLILPKMKLIYSLPSMLHFALHKPAFSYRENVLEYFQQTLLRRNKKLQLTPH